MFIDSFKFLSTSLEKLASYLDKDKLKIVCSKFSTLSNEKFELFVKVSFHTLTALKNAGMLIIARIIFQFIDGRYSIQEWLRSQRKRLAMILYPNARTMICIWKCLVIFENYFRKNASRVTVSCALLHLACFYVGHHAETYVRKIWVAHRYRYSHIHWARYTRWPQCLGRYTQANNKYMRSYDSSNTLCTMMWRIYTNGRCINYCQLSKTLRILMWARSLRIRSQVIFSRSISSIRSICTTDTLTYLSVAISRPANAKINF